MTTGTVKCHSPPQESWIDAFFFFRIACVWLAARTLEHQHHAAVEWALRTGCTKLGYWVLCRQPASPALCIAVAVDISSGYACSWWCGAGLPFGGDEEDE